MTRTTGTDDIPPDLVQRAREGEDAALEAVVALAYPRVRRWALVHTGDPAEADDLTQDVLVQVIGRIHSFKGDARFTSWLYSVTRNAALDSHRARARRSALHAEPGADAHIRPGDPPDPARATERREMSRLLTAFLHELPHRQREVVELVELQGVTSAEAGALMEIEAVSVRAHLHKARKTLRARILESHPHLVEDGP